MLGSQIMSRVPRQAKEVKELRSPFFPTFTVLGVTAVLLLIVISYWRSHRSQPSTPQTAAVAESESNAPQVADAANQSVDLAPATPSVRPQSTTLRVRPDSNPSVPASVAVPAEQLIGQLAQLQIANGKLSPGQ